MKKAIKSAAARIAAAIQVIGLPFLCLCCLVSRLTPRKYDIGIGPVPLINNVHWANALRRKGYRVQTFVDDCYFITDEFDVRFDQGVLRLARMIPVLMFLYCIFQYRCCYYYFNGGPLARLPLLRQLEPKLLHLAGVKVVVMPYGSDSQVLERTPNKLTANALCKDYSTFFRTRHRRVAQQVDLWCRYADVVVGSMDSVDYLWFWNKLRPCHYAVETELIEPQYPLPPKEGRKIKVFHAPNHLAIKGSEFVLQAIEELQQEGYPIELVYRRGVPNRQLLEELAQADIVVEQLIMGWHGIFGLESMASGKPVICYIRPDLQSLYENAGCIEAGELPFISAMPTTIKQVLKDLLDHPETWEAIGRRSRAYTEKYHSLEAVGSWFDSINREIGIEPRG